MGPTRAAVSATVATALLVGAFLVLFTWAAATGPDDLIRGDGPSVTPRSDVVTSTPTAAPSEAGPFADQRAGRGDEPSRAARWIGVLVSVIGVAAFAVVLGLGLRLLWRAVRDRVPDDPDPEELDFVPLTPVELARELARDRESQCRLLDGDTPRNGVVRCWDRFEQVAAAGGLARRGWETPAEFTLRLFDLVEADTVAVQRLATLYREARFSDHPLTEDDRRVAADALEAIHDSIGGRVP